MTVDEFWECWDVHTACVAEMRKQAERAGKK
jgi:hypothetical protein